MKKEPPPRFFADLRELCQSIRRELEEEGFKVVQYVSLPDVEWPDGWWNLRGVRVVARDPYGNRKMIERPFDVSKYRRRIRKVKR